MSPFCRARQASPEVSMPLVYVFPYDVVKNSHRTEQYFLALGFLRIPTARGDVWADARNRSRVLELCGEPVFRPPSPKPLTLKSPAFTPPQTSVGSPETQARSVQSQLKGWTLSGIEVEDWKACLLGMEANEELGFPKVAPMAHLLGFEPFEPIREALLAGNDPLAEECIQELGEAMLGTQDDVQQMLFHLKALGLNVTREELLDVKRYNYASASICFTAENYYSWTQLAAGRGRINDWRYVRHEIFEVKALKQMDLSYDFLDHHEETDAFDEHYRAAHVPALQDEAEFLAHAVKVEFGFEADWRAVAASDPERKDEFSALFEDEEEDDAPEPNEGLAKLLSAMKDKKLTEVRRGVLQ
ncbi:hypothetical protein ACQKGO_07660 [Corallococcus interemptor]|uniref:hypothetical protein n=1 Tax=Corallococcus interemptor TaxID=2316720 RepID=UPI003D07683A